MVHVDGPVGLDAMTVTFDDERAVSDAGIVLVATLAERLGIEALAQRMVRQRPDRPGARNAGRKVMALIYAMALGADCIDDCDVLRAGRTRRLARAFSVAAASGALVEIAGLGTPHGPGDLRLEAGALGRHLALPAGARRAGRRRRRARRRGLCDHVMP